MSYLLLIAIGPVQDFIAAARRTRDLWHGSTVLSELSKACARELEARNASLIFPSSTKSAAIPNKIMAEIEAADDDEVRTVTEKCMRAIDRRLNEEAQDALRRARTALSKDGIRIDEGRFHEQLKSFIELYSVWIQRRADYKTDRAAVERAMIARKHTRNFESHNGQPGVPKSALDGSRESVLTFPKDRPGNPGQHEVRHNEHLDAIGLVKRFGPGSDEPENRDPRKHFESTHDVAAIPYLYKLERSLPEVFQQLKAARPQSYSCLYRDNEVKIDPAILKELRKIPPQPPYYALLQGDGDGVGVAISRMKKKEEHQGFSERLSHFAERAEAVVEEHEGQPVYAGGDDVLALLPLHRALECAVSVAEEFSKAMAGLASPPTFSAGLAVVHALDPLSISRGIAASAEQQAKGVPGKNALGVTVCPRSGAEVSIAGNWDTLPQRLSNIVDLYNSRKLSKSFGHELANLLREWPNDLPEDALNPLALAIADKKRASGQAKTLLKHLATREQLSKLVQALFVARPFARAKREAQGKAEID